MPEVDEVEQKVIDIVAEQMGVTDLTDFADPAYVQGPLSEVLV